MLAQRKGDLVAVMVTMDRSPRKNYLGQTLKNLVRSGMLKSKRLDAFLVFDSDGGSDFAMDTLHEARLSRVKRERFTAMRSPQEKKLPASANVGQALLKGADLSPKWVVFLEDDIDVCDDFFDSVGLWLDEHERSDRFVYSFGAAYPSLKYLFERGVYYWDYPISNFYGTQCFAVRTQEARSLGHRLFNFPYEMNEQGAAYDIAMHRWSKELWPGILHFACSCPAFVQHVGQESIIAPRNKVHTFDSYPGPQWSYTRERHK